ncbi:MAG: class I SAM-dependent methyltransferase [Silvibacterium sp.]
MRQHTYPDTSKHESYLIPPEFPGEGQHPAKMQGHWVLARAGKRVLRPGGVELTWQMLDALAIGPQDRVVEFAPGLGVTAGMVLQKSPLAYWGVERDPAAVGRLRRRFAGATTRIVLGRAEESGLPDACASVVYGEALLSMQDQQHKNRIVSEACRLLTAEGRYGIHELCFLPDDIPDHLRHEIQAAMSREIHVGVQPLCQNEWIKLFKQNGLKVTWSGKAPMHLLEPRRLLADEGFVGGLCIAFRMAANPVLGQRILAMRRLFNQYGGHLGAISLVGQREQVAA